MIRLLIDECLSPTLVGVAHARGLDATHVNHMGWRSLPDRALMPYIVGGNYTFVTNNRADFLRLYRVVDVHAGLIIILPASKKPEQRRLFGLALDAIAEMSADMINQMVEVDRHGRVEMSRWPFEGENL